MFVFSKHFELDCVVSAIGLNNDNLYQQKDFDTEVGSLVMLFLRRLEPPVCLVAHNGSRFDFPLLAAELQSTGCSPLLLVNNQPVLCIDTWEMFRDLAGDPVTYPNRYLREASSSPPPTILSPDQKNSVNNWIDIADSDRGGKSEQVNNAGSSTIFHFFSAVEQTPPMKADCDVTENAAKKPKMVSDASDSNGDSDPHHAASHARRQLFPDSGSDDCTSRDGITSGSDVGDVSDMSLADHVGNLKTESGDSDAGNSHQVHGESHESTSSQNTNRTSGADDSSSTFQFAGFTRPGRKIIMTAAKRPSYKLVDLHQRIIGFEPAESHRAEDDCLTLARVFWLTPKAPAWADSHAVEFDRFRPLYVMRRKPLPPGKFPCTC